MKVKKIIDLTIPLAEEIPVFPGDPQPSFDKIRFVEEDGYNLSVLHLGTHSGTHVDAPNHFFQNGKKIDEVPLQQFIGRGVIFEVRGKEKSSPITIEDVKQTLTTVEAGDIALFHTGWMEYLGTEQYFEHPYIELTVIKELMKRGVKSIFIDTMNIDPPDGSSYAGHRALLSSGGIIGENICNLDQIDFDNPLIVAAPLKIVGLDGSPVRAVALHFEF
ncbi:cyclase family protein [Bacillus kwashiorkori]|uniref:cyclase family protein n=1 Tax=Bacillus kwashiorkori TaxID=1522318 RepID=UPI0007844D3E|nr:cyclase family protein [Bacillus kwashiorkori]